MDGFLLGSLLESGENNTVVATLGCAAIGRVSTEKTQAGSPSGLPCGHSQVEPPMVEAARKLDKTPVISEVCDRILQPPDGFRIGNTPEFPPLTVISQSTDLTNPNAPTPIVSSLTPPDPPKSQHELGDLGEYNLSSLSLTPANAPDGFCDPGVLRLTRILTWGPTIRNDHGNLRGPPFSSSPKPRPRESILGGGYDGLDYLSTDLNRDERG